MQTHGVLNNIKTYVQKKLNTGGGITDKFEKYFKSINFYGAGGLLINIHYVFIVNAIFTAINTVIDPSFLIRYFTRRKAVQKGQDSDLIQKEANEYIKLEHCLTD